MLLLLGMQHSTKGENKFYRLLCCNSHQREFKELLFYSSGTKNWVAINFYETDFIELDILILLQVKNFFLSLHNAGKLF